MDVSLSRTPVKAFKMMLVAIAMMMLVAFAAPAAQKVQCLENPAMERAVFDLVNQQRKNAGLKALTWSTPLSHCAQLRANECGVKFSHTRPNGQPWYTVNQKLMFGENLGRNYYSQHTLVYAWLCSQTHKAVLMNPNFKTAAVAVHTVGNQNYWAMEFGY